ncbi:MAG: hypothetical protein KGI78_04625, partial [Patescibacteria group bacterium]|nr:hypothetical protein [Patescibacteria group bacterium]
MDFKTLVTSLVGILNAYIVPAIFALIVLAFVWGAAKYFIIEGDEGAREHGRQLVLWGVIAIVVLVSLWGIVNILLSTLQIA